MPFDAYDEHDALGLAACVRDGAAAPDELLDAALLRIEQRNPALNAVIATCAEAARAELARRRTAGTDRLGPLAGVPVLVKDLVADVQGLPTWHGNRLLKARAAPAARDSEFVRRLRAAGALIIGKTATPEFGLLPYTEPESTGPTRNPWDPARTPGGSSGGSAAAVAANG